MTRTLRMTHFVPPFPHVIAAKLGLYAARDLEVVPHATTSSPEQLAQLNDGSVDVAVTAIDNLIAWNAGGADIAVIAMAEETTPLSLFGTPAFARTNELVGGRLAVDSPTNGFVIVLKQLLLNAGISEGYELVPSGGVRARLDALLDGSVDATLLGPPFDSQAQEAGMTLLEDFAQQRPEFPGQGLVAARSKLAETHDAVVDLLAAWGDAVSWSDEASDQQIESLIGGPAPGAVVRRAMPGSIVPDITRLEIVIDMRRALGLLPVGFLGAESIVDFAAARAAVKSNR